MGGDVISEVNSVNGLFVIDKPSHAECPKCGWLYLSGAAIIMLHLNNKEFFIGQGEDEVHECSNCKNQIRGGRSPALFAIFPTVLDAEKRAHELAELLLTDIEKFRSTIILCLSSGIVPLKLQ